jgi:type II secretory ATPase GspE/PulE/Tfp pilus assembly ATPase PilB-like protein
MQNPSAQGVRSDEVHFPLLEPYFRLANPDVVKFLEILTNEAANSSASDLFFEPEEKTIRVRMRIDGVLYDLGSLSVEIRDQLFSRVKVLSKLDPTEKRKIQEGQFTLELDGRTVNFRVEFAHTVLGECLVIRLHEKKTIILDLSKLGFSQDSFDKYKKILSQKSGLVLVCGPTGCGKTTTLYSTIMHLNQGKKFNVMTIEDPVEFRLEGTNQMQVAPELDFDFATGLKTILRLSPDIVLVGEIRDAETAKIAVESGFTGQLVLSTIHSQDAVGALYRLLDLGIETYFVNAAVSGILAQRLVRTNCPVCAKHVTPSQEENDLFTKVLGRVPQQIIRSDGCDQCKYVGFKGRSAIYEVLLVSTELRDLLREKVSEENIREHLLKTGHSSLLKEGLLKAEAGVTTVQEVLRNSMHLGATA